MKTIKLLTLFVAISIFTSCEKDQISESAPQAVEEPTDGISKQLRKKVSDLHFNSKHI